MVHQILSTLTSSQYWDSTLRLGAPIVLAALGALVASRAGVLFVAVEGVMLTATFASVAAAASTGSIALGVAAGCGAGIAMALFSTWLSIHLRAGDVVSGLVVAVGAIGLTSFLTQRWFPTGAYLATQRLKAPWTLPSSKGAWILLDQQPLVYVAVVLTVVVPLALRTKAGLRLRSCGEAMDVASGLGVRIVATRYAATAIAGAFTGLAGASLGLAVVGSFDGDPVAGRGFIALACVLLGGWRARWVAVAAISFAATDAFRFQADITGSQTWGPLLPYLATLVALATLQRRGRSGPRDEGKAIEEPAAAGVIA